VVLFVLAGLAVTKFLDVQAAFPVGLVLGLLVAPLVPVKGGGSCSISPPPPAESEE
jgi:hypothetical protein